MSKQPIHVRFMSNLDSDVDLSSKIALGNDNL